MARFSAEDDRSIYYEHYRGGNVPIVLIHGWPATGRVWDGLLPGLLKRGHEVVVVDQRCCGKSDKDFQDVSVSAFAADIVGLVDELSLTHPVINGWSFGGGVAAMAATRLGDRAGGLVLTCAMAPRLTTSDDWAYGMDSEGLAGFVAGIQADRPAGLRGLAEAAIHADVGEETLAWVTRSYLEAGPKVDDALLDLGEIDQRDALASLSIPALVFGATNDNFLPLEAAQKTADMIPEATFVTMQDVGHVPFLEDLETYQAALVAFLEQVASVSVA